MIMELVARVNEKLLRSYVFLQSLRVANSLKCGIYHRISSVKLKQNLCRKSSESICNSSMHSFRAKCLRSLLVAADVIVYLAPVVAVPFAWPVGVARFRLRKDYYQ